MDNNTLTGGYNNLPDNYTPKILIPLPGGLYTYARPDYEKQEFESIREFVTPMDVMPFGLQRHLAYTHYQIERGPFKKELSFEEMKELCFKDMLSELEGMASTWDVGTVLLDNFVSRAKKEGWLLSADAQLVFLR